MDRSDHNISTDHHPEGSDARPKDTLDRDQGETPQPSPSPSHGKGPVVDEEGRPLSGDGLTKSETPVVRPSTAERMDK
ncbi:hypothetical protein [Sphingomonas montanisoli]|uniref:Uncharacterized protein n=1 Tax=Sphingomonas montanisoli TaxID=2606412 RepID=A0A5D9CC68_9SPHN|nr:hypothetical protein [Sphingomonas montanisoli]TZG28722.1 hypothetical protein FYJ91_00810 [Sphingomonas montanisoli]